jgi:hypothetical protein
METNSKRKIQIENEEQKKVYYKPTFFKNKHSRHQSLYPTSFNPNYQKFELKERISKLNDVRFEGSAYFIESSAYWINLASNQATQSTKLKPLSHANNAFNTDLHSSSIVNKQDDPLTESEHRRAKPVKSVKLNRHESIENFLRLEPMRCMYCIGKPNFSRFWQDFKVLEKETTLTSRLKPEKSKFNDTNYISLNYFSPKT